MLHYRLRNIAPSMVQVHQIIDDLQLDGRDIGQKQTGRTRLHREEHYENV